VSVASVLASIRYAHGDGVIEPPLYTSSYYEVSFGVAAGGYGFEGAPFAGASIRIYERAGFLAGIPYGLFAGVAGGVAEAGASTPKVTTSTYETSTHIVTTTTTRERSPEEIARARAAADAATAIRDVPGHTEIQVYVPQGERRASGVAVSLYPLSFAGRVTLDVGMHVVRLRDDAGPTDGVRDGTRDFRSIGPSVRLGALVLGNRLQVEGEAMINAWYWGDDDDPMTATQERRGTVLRGCLAFNPLDRVVVRAGANTRTRFDDLGWSLEAGVRF
jgi:hypothetical protein